MGVTRTMVTQLEHWAQEAPDAPALHGGSATRGFTTHSFSDYRRQVHTVGRALLALGVTPGDNVTIIGRNRPEWVIADLGAIAAGAVPTPVYATNTAEQVAWLVNHCGAQVAIIDDVDQYEKFLSVRDQMPNLKKVVLMGDVAGRDDEWTIRWEDLAELAKSVPERELEALITGASPDDLALLCYTSGTTGEPKGVMLTHRNVEALGQNVSDRFDFEDLSERIVSYLPLCHVAEHVFTIVNQMDYGVDVYFCDDVNEIKDYLPAVKPTLFLAVPRVWEKFEAALKAKLGEATGIKAFLANWAMTTEASWAASERQEGQEITGITRVLADRLVLSKIKSALGMDEVKMCISGAARLNPSTAEFFASLGLPLHEAYGMTETTALISIAPQYQTKPGAVGKPITGVDVRIEADGEILVRGDNMTPGYYRNEAETEQLLDAQGWLHTGDVGHLDDEGFLLITDRKKELFKTSGGKYVAPAPIEASLKGIPEISQAVLVGDGEKFIGAVVALDPLLTPALAEKLGMPRDSTPAAVASSVAAERYIQARVDEVVNSSLARYEQIKKVSILSEEMTPESGDLTPTMKLRRKAIGTNHSKEIKAIFS